MTEIIQEPKPSFLFGNQFTVKLPADLRNELNDDIESFIPEEHPEGEPVTAKMVFIHIVEKFRQRTSSNKDFQKLRDEIKRLTQENQALTGDDGKVNQLIERINFLEGEVDELKVKNQDLVHVNNELKGSVSTLETRQVQENQIVLTLSKGENRVVQTIRERLSRTYKKDFSLKQIIFDLFWRYNKLQEVEFPGMYKQPMTPKEIDHILAINDKKQ